jgi:protein-S-isoprenylcysteine O-methyltransferase Ste14
MTHRVVEVLTAAAVVLLLVPQDTRAIALAALAAGVLLRLAGTTTRRLLCAVLVLLGVAAVFAETAWSARGGGVCLAAAGLAGLVTAPRWRRPTTRYERDPAVTSRDQWKAIDAGEDPTV